MLLEILAQTALGAVVSGVTIKTVPGAINVGLILGEELAKKSKKLEDFMLFETHSKEIIERYLQINNWLERKKVLEPSGSSVMKLDLPNDFITEIAANKKYWPFFEREKGKYV